MQDNKEKIKLVPDWVKWSTLVLDVALFLAWIFGTLFFREEVWELVQKGEPLVAANFYSGVNTLMERLPAMLGALATITVAIVGASGVSAALYNSKKGGNNYYPYKYWLGWKVRTFEKKHEDNWKEEAYKKVCESVKHLRPEDKEHSSQYWQIVFHLQKNDDIFFKVWNNREYYSCIDHKSNRDRRTIERLEKYIFIAIWEEDKERRGASKEDSPTATAGMSQGG